jgi:hypothetical protein
MSAQVKQTQRELLSDYKQTLEGIGPIADSCIESLNVMLSHLSKLQTIMIQLKQQSKTMIAGVDEQLRLQVEGDGGNSLYQQGSRPQITPSTTEE